jgi:hypothetical protein
MAWVATATIDGAAGLEVREAYGPDEDSAMEALMAPVLPRENVLNAWAVPVGERTHECTECGRLLARAEQKLEYDQLWCSRCWKECCGGEDE